MGEFELIAWLQKQLPGSDPAVLIGIGDDAAMLDIPPDQRLVISTDTLNEGVHFAATDPPRAVGHKSLAVSLSDLAAMGAQPRWLLLNLSLPELDQPWIEAFITGFSALAKAHGVVLIGGDTCRGRRSITVTAMGLVRQEMALTRAGARPGDRVVVSGVPGLARFALQERRAGRQPPEAAAQALDYPVPRLALGLALRGKASACIDLSDGLLQDLGHVLKASACGALIELERLPMAPALQAMEAQQRWELQLSGGDDYELCFCITPEALTRLRQSSAEVLLSDIGVVRAQTGIDCLQPGGALFQPPYRGYDHFQH